MKSKLMVTGAVALAALAAAACHDNGGGPAHAPPSTSQMLDTAQVLALAQQTSETSSPIAVNGGAVVLNDTSETSAPILFNVM